MKGPVGYGAARFIPKDIVMVYKIRFENFANASAPAQRVLIEHTFDQNIDIRTFQMEQIGFHIYVKDLTKRSFFQMVVDYDEMYPGLHVRVRGGLDVIRNKVTWEFQAVESETGIAPSDPRIGFLPPNNGTTGQGFVSFSVKLKDEVDTLTRISAIATIYFDENEPIDTPEYVNTVDDSAPSINVTVIEETLQSGTLGVAFTTNDVGSGFKSTDVLIKKDRGYENLLSSITENVFSIKLQSGMEHALLFLPKDHTGIRPTIEDAITNNSLVVYIPEKTGYCGNLNNCSGNGNCTKDNICICLPEYIGQDCSRGTPILEPPILLIRDAIGIEDHPVNLSLSASPVKDSTYDSLTIFIRHVPARLVFSHGKSDGDDWHIPENAFGQILMIPPKDYAGNITLSIEAILVNGQTNSSRRTSFNIELVPVIDGVTYDVNAGCYNSKMNYATLYIKLAHKDVDRSEKVRAIAHVPQGIRLNKGTLHGNRYFHLTENDTMSTLQISAEQNGAFSPFKIEIQIIVSEKGLQDSTTETIVLTIDKCEDKSTYSYRVNLHLEYNVEIDLEDKQAQEYQKLFDNTLSALKDFYSTSAQTRNILTNVNLLTIRKGSLIAIHDVVLRENVEERVTNALTSLRDDKQTIIIGNQSVVALSFDVIPETDVDGPYKLSTTVVAVVISVGGLILLTILTMICVYKRKPHKKGPSEISNSNVFVNPGFESMTGNGN